MNNTKFHIEVLEFIKNYLAIKSEIVLKDNFEKFDSEKNSQIMAGVSFPVNKTFTVLVNFNDTNNGFVRRLAHELVHVKQIESKRLDLIGNKISFDNKLYSFQEYQDMYDEIPFEVEAFEQERVIANAYWNKKDNV